jgi:hypothetical protein
MDMQSHMTARAGVFAFLAIAGALPLGAARAANDAQAVSSTIPAQMLPGYSYDVSVTMKNTGTTSWTGTGLYKLGQPVGSGLTAPGRVQLGGSESVDPGQQRVFEFTITAPIATGTYSITWQMVQEGVEWFGETVAKQVVVTFGPDLPPVPTITWPASPGAVVGSNRPDILWWTMPINGYEVRIGPFNDPTYAPSPADGWDSGGVSISSLTNSTMSGPLVAQRWYYVFVRFRNSNGWGPWSAPNRYFYVGGEWLNEPYLLTPQSDRQDDSSIAFRPGLNAGQSQYLVAYMSFTGTSVPFVGAWRTDWTGQRLTGANEITFSAGQDGSGATVATYNSVQDEYLVVCRDYHSHLYGQRITGSNGALAGSFPVNTGTPALEHAVAYGSGSNVYLEAWRDDGSGGASAVLARRFSGVNGAAMPEGIITINRDGHQVGGPCIAYNSAWDEFLVVYQYVVNNNQQDLYCRGVSASTGQFTDSGRILLAGSGYTDWEPGIAYDSELNRFLLVYSMLGHPTSSPWGQLVGPNGQPIGSAFPIVTGDPYKGGAASVTWNSHTKEFLAGWNSGNSHWNYARRLGQRGTNDEDPLPFIGEPFKINGTIDDEYGNLSTRVMANPVDDDYVFCWQSGHKNPYSRHYKAYPLPPPDVQPPAPVTQLVVDRRLGPLTLTWTNPSTADFAGTTIRYRTDRFPSGASDGVLLADGPGAPGSTDSVAHSGLAGGTTYYYAVYAHDEVPNYAEPATISKTFWAADLDADGDVDQEDFGLFQACLAGSGQSYSPACASADLEGDGDVDQDDFGLFSTCMRGSNQPPGC